jgi:hypothetical protein
MFEGIMVGDKVWSIRYGWGTVYRIKENEYGRHYDFPIIVQFESTKFVINYNYDGYYNKKHAVPDLYWDEVKITPPQKPKKKKEIDGYIVGAYDDSPSCCKALVVKVRIINNCNDHFEGKCKLVYEA